MQKFGCQQNLATPSNQDPIEKQSWPLYVCYITLIMFLYNIEDTQEASSLRISITFDFFSKSNNFLMFTEPFLLLYILTGI